MIFVHVSHFRYESNSFSTAEHGGTHVDSPAHFYKGGWRTQQIPMEKLVGRGAIINVKQKASTNPDYPFSFPLLISLTMRTLTGGSLLGR